MKTFIVTFADKTELTMKAPEHIKRADDFMYYLLDCAVIKDEKTGIVYATRAIVSVKEVK